MNRSLICLFSFMLIFCHNAKSDFIIINGVSHQLTSESPLNQYPLVKTIKEKLISYRTTAYDDPCDSYNAEWTVVNNELYLTNIYNCNDTRHQYKTELPPLFNGDGLAAVKNGMVKAVWFTGDLWIATGKQIYTFDIVQSFYDSETRIGITNGHIANRQIFNYPHPQGLIYATGGNEVGEFIYSNINWDKMPLVKLPVKRVSVSFETGPAGKAENIKLNRENPQDSVFNNEVLRVFSTIPLGAYYKHGKVYKQVWNMLITFSEQMRQKYSK